MEFIIVMAIVHVFFGIGMLITWLTIRRDTEFSEFRQAFWQSYHIIMGTSIVTYGVLSLVC